MDEAAPFGTFELHGFVRRAVELTRALPDQWLARRLLLLVRRLVTRRLRGKPVDVTALGVRMRLKPYSNICEKRMLFAPATFDPEELSLLAGQMHEGFTFIDVGANVGAYALFVASIGGPSARILAVEPQPDIFERLVYNVRLNAFATVKAFNCAIADKPGEVTLFLDAKNSGESSVKIVTSGGAKPIRVPGKMLLDLVEEEALDRVDAIKLDIEGAEDLVLEPFLNSAPAHLFPALLIIENGLRQWQADLPALLETKGYALVRRTRLNLVYERRTAVPLERSHV